ncbi:hypothetical protein AF60_09280 [Streptococcus uberis S6261]|nr:hypothetical protein AF60_09280 [Streptococcus uberis S6261]
MIRRKAMSKLFIVAILAIIIALYAGDKKK